MGGEVTFFQGREIEVVEFQSLGSMNRGNRHSISTGIIEVIGGELIPELVEGGQGLGVVIELNQIGSKLIKKSRQGGWRGGIYFIKKTSSEG